MTNRQIIKHLRECLASDDKRYKKLRLKFCRIVQKHEKLNERRKQSALLVYKDRRSIKEVAQIMGITEVSVMTNIKDVFGRVIKEMEALELDKLRLQRPKR